MSRRVFVYLCLLMALVAGPLPGTVARAQTPTAAATATNTPVPPPGTSTPTSTPVPPTATSAPAPPAPPAPVVNLPTSTATATATSVPPTGTMTATASATAATIAAPATATAAAPATATQVPSLVIHNNPRTVVGGRQAACTIAGNTHGAHEPGCEIVSSISAPGATVVYTLTYANGTKQTFTDQTDYRGHSLHPFNAAYLPRPGSKHGQPATVAYIAVTAKLSDGTMLGPATTRFAVIR